MSIVATKPSAASSSKFTEQHIVLVDDNEVIVNMVRMVLEKRGYRVTVGRNGQEALELIKKHTPDLILLDLMMPKLDGLQICKAVRANTNTPIIVISAIESEEQKVELLDLGADDYLTKPFGQEELMARIRAVMRRRCEDTTSTESLIRLGDLAVDFETRAVAMNGEPARLTPTEFKLLAEFVQHPDVILTHGQLLSRVWGKSYIDSVEYLHIYVGRLRKKLAVLKDVELQTYPGTGYSLKTKQI